LNLVQNLGHKQVGGMHPHVTALSSAKRAAEHAAERVAEHAAERAAEHAAERAAEHAAERAAEHAVERDADYPTAVCITASRGHLGCQPALSRSLIRGLLRLILAP
jgi:DNA-binding LacI/PurR family transcriptional regulator